MRRWTLSALLLGAWFSRVAAQEPALEPYQVKPGDSCSKIAAERYGDAARYDLIHRYNPTLGPAPHKLRPGSTLLLPPSAVSGPEAQITVAVRDVRAQPPTAADWQHATEGTELYRNWRVSTLERSAAEVTYRDRSALYLRENTLVVIYAAPPAPARQAAEAYLERGTLRSFLGQLRMQVRTPGAAAALRGGQAVVDVDDAAISRLSNFDGGSAGLQSASGGQVEVQPGFGSKVVQHAPPTPPKPLPPTPLWDASMPAQFVSLAAHGGSIGGSWQPVAKAAAYRVELSSDAEGRQLVMAAEVPAAVTRFEAHFLPPGTYHARVSSVDADRFESRPSAPARLSLVGLTLDAPGQAADRFDPGDPSREPAPARLPVGSKLGMPEGLRCGMADAPPSAAMIVRAGGLQDIVCETAEGQKLPALRVEVIRPVFSWLSGGADLGASLRVGESRSLRFAVQPDLPLEQLDVQLDAGLRVSAPLRWQSAEILELGVQAAAPGRQALTILARGAESVPLQRVWLQVVQAPAPAAEAPTPVPAQPSVLLGPASPDLQQVQPQPPPTAAVWSALGYLGGARTGDDHAFRAAVGARLGLWSRRLALEAGFTRDLQPGAAISREARGLQLGAALHHALTPRLRVAARLNGWLPTGERVRDLRHVRLSPGVQASFDLGAALRLETQQAAVLGLGAREAALWSSSYALQGCVLGPLCAGAGLDLALGRLANAPFRGVAAQLGAGLALGALQLSAALRLALDDDYARRFGRVGLSSQLTLEL